MAAAIQHHQEGDRALSTSRLVASRQPSGRDRSQGSRPRNMDTRSFINHNHDARNIIGGQRRKWDEEEQRRRDNYRERFGIINDQQRCDDRHDRCTPPRPSPPLQGEEPLGTDGIRAFSAWLRQADWPSDFHPKGIKTYDGDRDPEAWLRSTPRRSKLQVVARAQWPTTYQSSCLQPYKTSPQDS